MIITSTIVGLLAPSFIKILNIISQTIDAKKEYALFKLQLESNEKMQSSKLEETKFIADSEVNKEMYKYASKLKTYKWVNGIVMLIRPLITLVSYLLYIYLTYVLVKVLYVKDYLAIYEQYTNTIGFITGFWFGNRSIEKSNN